MPVHTALWKVGPQPEQLLESSLTTESSLEQMIVSAPHLLSEEWMIIGRQEDTGFGGRIDLLAMAPDASLVLIELKRNRTPREVVAQTLDYAGWVEGLVAEDIDSIYQRFSPGRSLAHDFHDQFGQNLPDDSINQNHQLIIVASSLDESTERIVNYLNARQVPINVLFFQIFMLGSEQLLSRTWLIDPVHTQVSAASAAKGSSEPWNGEFYCSFGEGPSRSWQDAVEFGFFCAGGGAWYSKTLQLLSLGDRIWVKVPKLGFVGVGRIRGRAQPASEFTVKTPAGEKPVFDVARSGTYHREVAEDPERCEYFVSVEWLQTKTLRDAVQEVGFFGNQNSVCKPTTPKWRTTVERLKFSFPLFDNSRA